MAKRGLLLLVCLSMLLSGIGCAKVPTKNTETTGLAGFTQALTTAGYQTVFTTSPNGTTVISLVPPTTVSVQIPTVPVAQPTAPTRTTSTTVVPTQTAKAPFTTVNKTTTTAPSVVMPEIILPEIIIPQPTVPTTAAPKPVVTTVAASVTTAAPVVPHTTTVAPVGTVTQPTVPTTKVQITTVPATTLPVPTVQATTIPATTVPVTVPATTALPMTVPVTTIPTTTIPVTTITVTTILPTTVPATTVSATTVPATTVPATTVPETTQPSPTYGDTGYQTQTAIHYSQRYLYSILSDVQKQWYQKIDAAVRNLEDEVILGPGLLDNENYYIYFLYMMDNPEHFYLTNRIGIFDSSEGQGLILGYSDGTLTSGVELGGASDALKSSIRTKQTTLNAKVTEILQTVSPELPDVEKEFLLYRRIILGGSYNQQAQWDGYAEDNWTAYGILINGLGVCESYSEAFQLLCYAVGINCTGIIGGGHKWNAVQLDGEWYMCDPTWDDPVGGIPFIAYHDYFNLTTQQILLDHEIDESHWQVPVCTATKYSYQNYFGN